MKVSFVMAALLGALVPGCGDLDASVFEAKEPSESQEGEIVGGRDEYGYPSVGLLWIGGGKCTATLISSDAVVTAAHCVRTASVGSTYFVLGRFKVDAAGNIDWNGAVGYPVSAILIHPEYYSSRGTAQEGPHDVAIVRLRIPVTNVPTASLAWTVASSNGFGCSTHRFVGYGSTDFEVLADGKVQGKRAGVRKSMSACIAAVYPNEVLAQSSEGAICFGDSGGPLFAEGTQELVGVLSDWPGSSGYCSNRSTLMVRVDTHRAFIHQAFLPQCGVGLYCDFSGKVIGGASQCMAPPTGTTPYCCPAGQTIVNGSCQAPSLPPCGSGLYCAGYYIPNASQCLAGSTSLYCCPYGQNFSTGRCQ